MKKKVYISGKITGEPINLCEVKFLSTQKELESRGYIAINPLEVVAGKLDLTQNKKEIWLQAMDICIKALATCDYIYLLPDWQYSRGARIEKMIADSFRIKTLYDNNNIKF